MGGLLSAFEKYPDVSFLVVGCDYPFVQIADLQKLVDASRNANLAITYYNEKEQIREPLLGVYKPDCHELLLKQFEQQNYSLNHFLKTTSTAPAPAPGGPPLRTQPPPPVPACPPPHARSPARAHPGQHRHRHSPLARAPSHREADHAAADDEQIRRALTLRHTLMLTRPRRRDARLRAPARRSRGIRACQTLRRCKPAIKAPNAAPAWVRRGCTSSVPRSPPAATMAIAVCTRCSEPPPPGASTSSSSSKDISDAELLPVLRSVRDLCRELSLLFVVNDRPQLALDVDADAVHVGQDDMPVPEVRRIVGPEMLIGLSTHRPARSTRPPRSQPTARPSSTTSASDPSTRRRPSPGDRPSEPASCATHPPTPARRSSRSAGCTRATFTR